MNTSSIISMGIAFLSLLFSIIYNTTNIKRSRDKDTQDLIALIHKESVERGENKALFEAMNKNLEKIVEDNKVMNERIYSLAERVAALEYCQRENDAINKAFPILENKVGKAHQRIDITEHDLGKETHNVKTV